MKIIFEADSGMALQVAKVTTHPAEKELWGQLTHAIHSAERKIVVIDARNDRKVEVPLSTIAVIQSEDRMCSVRLITGEMYLLGKRLKVVEEDLGSAAFMKINNQTIINMSYITAFSSTDQARVEVVLHDQSSYFVSRHYMKTFKERLS
ncbi:DNA-binding LytR/AlgR family response regulator [Paenibacillus phyllosphaerae]|uniref:DNA-binding LytR/AlgR family response regulator n=1 Tax=Paenibacillus phyllosphaerae TaxID=274593 RepID=A0A7W5B3T9_9BACL|nr:LytTR family DNA-binding domain-containing protein [Paenibacillus phyllosphaerae]MBB3113196.1 DNA-binding LytR/AlgR family response regulator [Paenibacillus phyllosphaerae]